MKEATITKDGNLFYVEGEMFQSFDKVVERIKVILEMEKPKAEKFKVSVLYNRGLGNEILDYEMESASYAEAYEAAKSHSVEKYDDAFIEVKVRPL